MPYLGIFGLEFDKKTIILFEISTLEFIKLQTFVLGTKNALFWSEYEKINAIFEISTVEFVKIQSFMLKGKK